MGYRWIRIRDRDPAVFHRASICFFPPNATDDHSSRCTRGMATRQGSRHSEMERARSSIHPLESPELAHDAPTGY